MGDAMNADSGDLKCLSALPPTMVNFKEYDVGLREKAEECLANVEIRTGVSQGQSWFPTLSPNLKSKSVNCVSKNTITQLRLSSESGVFKTKIDAMYRNGCLRFGI